MAVLYRKSWDVTSIPDSVIYSEASRRRGRKRRDFSTAGRPKGVKNKPKDDGGAGLLAELERVERALAAQCSLHAWCRGGGGHEGECRC